MKKSAIPKHNLTPTMQLSQNWVLQQIMTLVCTVHISTVQLQRLSSWEHSTTGYSPIVGFQAESMNWNLEMSNHSNHSNFRKTTCDNANHAPHPSGSAFCILWALELLQEHITKSWNCREIWVPLRVQHAFRQCSHTNYIQKNAYSIPSYNLK